MEKIDLNVGRGFSDCITVMFNFVKQEFKPLMKAAGFIVLPLLLVDMVLKSFFISDICAYTSLIDEGDVLWDAGCMPKDLQRVMPCLCRSGKFGK